MLSIFAIPKQNGRVLYHSHNRLYETSNGSIAQLVQSVCLTSRGSGVRLPLLPPPERANQSKILKSSDFGIFCFWPEQRFLKNSGNVGNVDIFSKIGINAGEMSTPFRLMPPYLCNV